MRRKRYAVYHVVKDTQVLVIDKDFVMHKHIMKGPRDFRADTRLHESYAEPIEFSSVRSTQRWSIHDLESLQMWVFATGHSKGPYIIIKTDHLCKGK